MAQHDSPRSVFDPLVSRLIRDSARRVVERANLLRDDLADIEQDLRLHLWAHRNAYRPERGAPSTFAKVVIQHKALSLIRDYRAARRRGEIVPLDSSGAGDPDPSSEAGRAWSAASRQVDAGWDVAVERRIDVRSAIQRMHLRDRELARCLMAQRVCEISALTGVPRATLYDRIRSIRRLLTARGVDAYVERRPTFSKRSA